MMKRLASDICVKSQWRRVYAIGFLMLGIAILFMTSLSWWVLLIITVLAVVAFIFSEQTQDKLLHITAPNNRTITDSTQQDASKLWQLLYSGHKKTELWEAYLLKTQSFTHCVQLTVRTVHPVSQQKTIVIWQDQVDAEVWRQLKALCNWS